MTPSFTPDSPPWGQNPRTVGWQVWAGNPDTPLVITANLPGDPPRLVAHTKLGPTPVPGLYAPNTTQWDTRTWPDSRYYELTITAEAFEGAPAVTQTVSPVYVDSTPPVVSSSSPVVTVIDGNVYGPIIDSSGWVDVTVADNLWAYDLEIHWRHLPDLRGCDLSGTPYPLFGTDPAVGQVRITMPGGCITDQSLYGTWILTVAGKDLNLNRSLPLGPFAFVIPPP